MTSFRFMRKCDLPQRAYHKMKHIFVLSNTSPTEVNLSCAIPMVFLGADHQLMDLFVVNIGIAIFILKLFEVCYIFALHGKVYM